MKPQQYDAFGSPPNTVAPDQPVRYWHHAFFYGLVGFAFAYFALGYLGYAINPPFHARATKELILGLSYGFNFLTLGIGGSDELLAHLSSPQHRSFSLYRILVAWAGGLALGSYLFIKGARPRKNMWVVDGPRLLQGEEALQEARRRCPTHKELRTDPKHLAIHPCLILPKRKASQHMLIYGGVGSGKTQILLRLIKQVVGRDDKLFLYDVKGDFTAKFRRPILLSPFDKRSWVWDVAKDVRTITQASAFADSLIPEDQGSGKFWSEAARQILIGVIRSLQNEMDGTWTWTDLAQRVSQQSEAMSDTLWKHYRRAHNLLGGEKGGQTAFNVLATLNGYTRAIDDLARAWPQPIKNRSFSLTDWAKDDYKGRKQIIVQSGTDATLTRAYIASMINVLVPSIVSPALPDNEQRFLGFFLDELSSIGKINFAPLVDKGRSKGVVFIACVQDLAQVEKIYGKEDSKALSSMVGTHIICQVQQGDTRENLSKMFGTNKVAILPHGRGSKLHTEGRSVIYPHQLTDDLGFEKGPHFGKVGWGIKAIVYTGGDPLLLPFPGFPLKDRRRGQVPAPWTMGPAREEKGDVPIPNDPNTQGRALGEDEINQLLQD